MKPGLIIDIVVAMIAGGGLLLGILNWIRDQRRDSVRLLVRPKALVKTGITTLGQPYFIYDEDEFSIDYNRHLFAIEVVNLSLFPLRLCEIGFKKSFTRDRASVPLVRTESGEYLPRGIEPRESITFHVRLQELLRTAGSTTFSRAYVKTQCGAVEYGRSKALKKLRNAATKYRIVEGEHPISNEEPPLNRNAELTKDKR